MCPFNDLSSADFTVDFTVSSVTRTHQHQRQEVLVTMSRGLTRHRFYVEFGRVWSSTGLGA